MPQVIVHRVEATSRLSPIPAGVTATSTSGLPSLNTASVDECTIYSQDEESFSESTLEQTTTFEQTLESSQEQEGQIDQKLEAEEDEILAEVTVDQKSGSERLKIPEDDIELYSSGEETFDSWTVETYRVYEVTKNIEADVTLRRSKQLAAASQGAGILYIIIISVLSIDWCPSL